MPRECRVPAYRDKCKRVVWQVTLLVTSCKLREARVWTREIMEAGRMSLSLWGLGGGYLRVREWPMWRPLLG